MEKVLVELRRAAFTKSNLSLCHARGISPDDVVQIAITTSLSRGKGVAFVTDHVDMRRYAVVAVRDALYGEARKSRRRSDDVDISGKLNIVDDSVPDPLSFMLERAEPRVDTSHGRRVLAMAMEFPTLAHVLDGGPSYSEQAKSLGVAPSTITRRAKKAIKQIREFFLGAQLQFPLG